MKNYKVAILIGGRPQIIKAYPLVRELAHHKSINWFLINSGQHYSDELSKNFLDEFNIKKPKFNIYSKSTSSDRQLLKIISELKKIFLLEKPDCVILFGDMNTTLAGAISAAMTSIPIIHVEAGIRSYNNLMMEERNRIITDRLAKILIVPDIQAVKNLKKEGISTKPSSPNNNQPKIIIGGDIMLEALKLISDKHQSGSSESYSLLTIHRAENTISISALKSKLDFVQTHSSNSSKIIFPVHPRTKKLLKNVKFSSKFKIIPPVSYCEIIKLAKKADIVFTDSGGLQKETCWLGKPCVVLRDQTEWPGLIKSKRSVLFSNFKKGFKFRLHKEKLKHKTSRIIIQSIKDNL